MKKKMSLLLMMCAMAVCLLVPVSASAQVYDDEKVLEAGESWYIRNVDIAGSRINKNSFTITPLGTGTKYDVIYARGTSSDPYVKMAVNLTSTLKSGYTSAYIKNGSDGNVGTLAGIRVRSGSVEVSVRQSGGGAFALKWANNNTPLVVLRRLTGKKARFQMEDGNLKNIPLILCGTYGAKIRRILSITDRNYEIYSFGKKKMTRTVYRGGRKAEVKSFSYQSKCSVQGDQYFCVLMYFVPSASERSTGWMQTTKGKALFWYSRFFLGMKYNVR